MAFHVENIVARHPETHIWMSADVSTVANTGCIILRNSLWSESFLLDWLACKDELGSLNEQLGLQCTIRLHGGAIPEQLSILDGAALNSLAPAMGKQLPHHQILHLAAEDAALRAAVFKEVAQTLAANIHSLESLPYQMSMSRQRLQQLSITIYQEIFASTEGVIRQSLERDLPKGLLDVEIVAKYRLAASKLVHSKLYHLQDNAQFSGSDISEDDLINLIITQDQAYQLILEMLMETLSIVLQLDSKAVETLLWKANSAPKLYGQLNSVFGANPNKSFGIEIALTQKIAELLKIAAELGYELLISYVDYIILSQMPMDADATVGVLLNEISALLSLLQVVVHPRQRVLVDDMRRDFDDYVSNYLKGI
eukprot:gene3826-4177_t